MRKIGKWLILVGMIIMLIPIIGRIYVTYKQQQLFKIYEESVQVVPEQKIDKETDQASEKLTKKSAQQTKQEIQDDWQCPKDVQAGDVLGKIAINNIDLDLLLIEGTDDSELGLGAGHMPETALPGQEGNCVIAGHRNYTFGSMFNRLDEVQIGDDINVELAGKVFTYRVTQIMITEPDDLTVIAQDKRIKELTLITCHPVYSSTQRLIIRGKLIE